MAWFAQNAALFASMASLAMLVVWTFYAFLFYQEFQRQRRPFFVIHQAQGHGLDSTCLIVNLSREPVHILCVILVLHTTRGVFTQRLRNFRRIGRTPGGGGMIDVQTSIKQGPLTSGAFLSLGSFEDMLEAATEDALRRSGGWGVRDEEIELDDMIHEVEQVDIRVIGLHAAHSRPVGASRRFRLYHEDEDDGVAVEPAVLLTRQMASRAEGRIVREWLQKCLPRPVADER